MNKRTYTPVRRSIASLVLCGLFLSVEAHAQDSAVLPTLVQGLRPETHVVDAPVKYLTSDQKAGWIAAALGNGNAILWNAATAQAYNFHPSSSNACTVALHDNGNLLAIGGQSGEVLFWEIGGKGDGKIESPTSVLKLESVPVNSLAFGHNGSRDILAVGSQSELLIENCGSGQDQSRVRVPEEIKRIHVAGTIQRLAFSPDGASLAIAVTSVDDSGRHLYVVCYVTVSPQGVISSLNYLDENMHSKPISGLYFDLHGHELISCDETGLAVKWNMDTKTPVARYRRGDKSASGATSVVFSRESGLIVSYDDGKIGLFRDRRSGVDKVILASFIARVHTSRVTALCLLPSGGESAHLVTGSYDKSIRIWNVAALWKAAGEDQIASDATQSANKDDKRFSIDAPLEIKLPTAAANGVSQGVTYGDDLGVTAYLPGKRSRVEDEQGLWSTNDTGVMFQVTRGKYTEPNGSPESQIAEAERAMEEKLKAKAIADAIPAEGPPCQAFQITRNLRDNNDVLIQAQVRGRFYAYRGWIYRFLVIRPLTTKKPQESVGPEIDSFFRSVTFPGAIVATKSADAPTPIRLVMKKIQAGTQQPVDLAQTTYLPAGSYAIIAEYSEYARTEQVFEVHPPSVSDPAVQTIVLMAKLRPLTKINPIDGSVMTLIPGGVFRMGDSKDTNHAAAVLKSYWMYSSPVTIGQFKSFCSATRTKMPEAPFFDQGWEQDDHPMVRVSWEDALAYCKWAHVNLPTEVQWEMAARGKDGRKYPWGNDWLTTKCANSVGHSLNGTLAVGKFTDSPYGLSDMAGNVWQWCLDWCDAVHSQHVIRGGSWFDNDPNEFLSTYRDRHDPERNSLMNGFRCAVSVEDAGSAAAPTGSKDKASRAAAAP